MNIIFNDLESRIHLLPLSFTRPVSTLRIGILTIKEKWEKRLEGTYSFFTEDYLAKKYPLISNEVSIVIYGGLCPNDQLIDELKNLKLGQALTFNNEVIASFQEGHEHQIADEKIETKSNPTTVKRPWDLFSKNNVELEMDYELLTKGRKSTELSSTNTIIGDRVFAEEGVEVEAAILNSKNGPIYLAKGSSIMEGSMVRGGLSLGEYSQLKLGTKIYGAVTIGPHSKVGGEVNNSVIQGYSNKGHDGFLGNSVIGEWCNLGADTNNSNLKNNYDEVKLWSYAKKGFERTGLQFCGLIMGDHSKCGINTMFNTGTVIGVSSNIFGSGFPRNFVPSFSWGGASGFVEYKLDKALKTAEIVFGRRSVELDATERQILTHIYEQTRS